MDNLELKITESVKKELQKYKLNEVIIPHNSITNIFSIPEKLRNNPLMEGYYASYDMEKIKKFLDKRYGNYADIFISENENHEYVFIVITFDNKENKSIIDKDMSLAGYFPSFVEHKNNGTMHIQYEPRHQNAVNDTVQDEEYIYHLTPTVNVKKIQKIGLTPKTKNKMFEYPERIYFLLHEPDEEDCIFIAKQLKMYEKNPQRQYTLLKIDTEKIKNINFFFDPNAEDCVYTKDNIAPNAIEIERNIEFKNETRI